MPRLIGQPQVSRYHEKCGLVTLRYADGECRLCSMERKQDARKGIVRTHTANTRTWVIPAMHKMTVTIEPM